MISPDLKVGVSPYDSISWYQFPVNQFKESRLTGSIGTNQSYSRLQVHPKVNIIINQGLRGPGIINTPSRVLKHTLSGPYLKLTP